MNLKLPIFSFIFFLFFSASTLFAQSPQFEGKSVASFEITIHGLAEGEEFDQQAILNQMKTAVGDPFDQLVFDGDLKFLAKEYDRVEPRFRVVNKTLMISLEIWFKPTIRKIVWEGNEQIKETRLRKELNIPLQTAFDRSAFNKAFNAIKKYYIKKGFFEAELNFKVEPIEETNEVDITVTIKEGRSGLIKNIRFTGFSKDEEEEILKGMLTKHYKFYSSWITGDGVYHDEIVEQDRLTILNFLQNRGFANANVEIRIVPHGKKKKRINLEIVAHKGELFTVSSLFFKGNTLINDDEVFQHFNIRKGDPFSPEAVRKGIRSLTDYYGTKGYIDAYVSYQPRLVEGKNEYAIHCQLHEGKQFRVGMIKIFGNSYTQSRVILHETLLTPGELFDVRKLRGSEERLHMINYFKNVNVYAVKPSEKSELGTSFRDVHIEVEEKTTGGFSFAFGVSTLESVFGSIELNEKNFNYQGFADLRKEGIKALRGGGEYAFFRLSVGRKHRNYLFSWTKPYFRDTPWIVGFAVEKSNNRQQSKDYDIDSMSFSMHATYPFNSYLKLRWEYRLRDVTLNIASDASQLLRDEAENNGVVSATGLSLIYDSTDSPYKPRKGFRSELDFEIAGLGGDFNFFRTNYLNTYYEELHKRGVMKYRLDLRFIDPFSSTTATTLPLAERLYLGGDTSVRGFRGYSIGPKYDNGDPRGGISSALVSMEYLHNITDRFDGFLYYDAGTVTLDKFRISNMKISYGFGIRFEIFKHFPLTFGIGYPVNNEDRSEVKRFFMTLGGRF